MFSSSPTRLIAVLSLLGAGLTIGAGPVSAAAVEPYPFNDESLTLFKVPPYPASLVTAGGRGVFATLTLNGLVSQDFGLTTDDTSLFTDELRHTWAHDEEYGDTGGQLNADPARLLHAVGVAVGDLDGNGTAADPKVEAAYLVRGSAGSDDHLFVMGLPGPGLPAPRRQGHHRRRPLTGDDGEDRHRPGAALRALPDLAEGLPVQLRRHRQAVRGDSSRWATSSATARSTSTSTTARRGSTRARTRASAPRPVPVPSR